MNEEKINVAYQLTAIEPAVEKMARLMVEQGGGNPDMMMQPGTPQVYGTPSGDVFTVAPGSEQPLWRFFISSARKMLELCREVDGAAVSDVSPAPYPIGEAAE